MAAVLVNVRAQGETVVKCRMQTVCNVEDRHWSTQKKLCTQCTSLPSGTYPGLRPIVWKPWCVCCYTLASLATTQTTTRTTDSRCRGSQKERDHVRLVTHPSMYIQCTSLQRTYALYVYLPVVSYSTYDTCMKLPSPKMDLLDSSLLQPTRESVITRTSYNSDYASRVISSADWTPWGTIGRCCDS
jgi:hypothetical protein